MKQCNYVTVPPIKGDSFSIASIVDNYQSFKAFFKIAENLSNLKNILESDNCSEVTQEFIISFIKTMLSEIGIQHVIIKTHSVVDKIRYSIVDINVCSDIAFDVVNMCHIQYAANNTPFIINVYLIPKDDAVYNIVDKF